MRNLRYYAYLFTSILLVFASCSKDKGSYDYIEVNKLTLLDQDGQEIINRDYSIRYGRELRIIPEIVASSTTWDKNNVKFTWILSKDTVSFENKLILNTTDVGVGTKLGKLIVTDNSTSISYSANFKVIIAAGISKGSFILTQDEAFQSTLVLRDINTAEDYLYINQFNSIKLGKYPLNLNIGSTAKSATNVEYRRALMTTKEGEYPIMAIDLNEFLPSILYPMSGATVNGELLVPSYSWNNPAKLSTNNINGIVLIDGKCYNMAQGIVSGDVYAYDPLNYYFEANAVCPSRILNDSFVAGFDSRNQRIRVFGNNLKGDGMFTLNYDNITDPNLTQGHIFIAVSEIFDNDLRWQFLTRKNTTIFMHNATMDIDNYPYKLKSVTTLASKEVPEMVDAVDFKVSGSYWYFAKGRTIYQFSVNGLDISTYLTLPDDGSGDIVAWNFNINPASNYTKMGIATYNAAANKTYKGSYYLYDMLSNSYDSKELNVIDKAVKIQIGL